MTTTLAALLVLCVLAPASQQAVVESPNSAGRQAQPSAATLDAQLDAAQVPGLSLSLALHGTEVAAAPQASSDQPEPDERAVEREAAEADPLPATSKQPSARALADAKDEAEAASDSAQTADPSTGSSAAEEPLRERATPQDSLAALPLGDDEASAAEEFLAEQLLAQEQGDKRRMDELLASTEAAMPVSEVEQAKAVATLESAVKKKGQPKVQPPFEMLDSMIQAGTMKRLTWNATEAFSGTTVPTPVLVAHGVQAGPTLCLTAAVHGDELNGIETVRRIIHDIPPEKLSGTLIGVPIVNMAGFQRHSRYLPDRRDLNRFFPGHPRGSSASRIAYSFFREVIVRCDGLVDLHTGSFHRTNLPQLRANLNNDAVVKLTEGFGSTIILHSDGGMGTLRRAAVEAGIPAVTLEAGEPLRLQDDEVKHSVKGIYTLLETLGMYDKRGIRGSPEPVYYTSEWIRADTGGILFSSIKLGKSIKRDDLLGTVTDPISNEREEIRSPFSGRVIGMALNQFVMPGFATYHIGIEAEDADEAMQDEDAVNLSHDVAFEPDLDMVE